MKTVLSIAIFALVAAGCAPKLSPEAEAVKLMRAAPTSCSQLGRVDATGLKAGGNSNFAQIERLRDQTAALGGNAVYIDTVTGRGFKQGTAYKCLQ